MRRFTGLLIAAIALVAASAANADNSMGSATTMKPVIVTPATIKWMPGTGELKGLMVAVLDGDPSKSGPFTMRIKTPGSVKLPVHYHDDTERVTVISGMFMAAIGDKYDDSKLMELPPGSFVVIPGGVRHYAATKGETVVQVSGNGPFAMKSDDKTGM